MMIIVFLFALFGLVSGSTFVAADEPLDLRPFRFTVKTEASGESWYLGVVESGTLRPGDVVYIDPDGRKVFGYVQSIQTGPCPVRKTSAGTQASLQILASSSPVVGDVLVRVDEYYDDPAPALPVEIEPSFELLVEDSFSRRGVGTVVMGSVSRGSVEVADRVTIEDPDGGRRQSIVTSILKNHETVERAGVGDVVGLALRGVDRDEVGRCSRLMIPGDDS
jgi:GTPase